MYAYKITGTTSFECIEIKEDEINNYNNNEWYISEKEVNWSTHMYLNGIIVEVPIIEKVEQPIYIPTKDDLLQQLDNEYQPQFSELIKAWSNATMDSDQYLANKLQISKTILKTEYESKRGVIING